MTKYFRSTQDPRRNSCRLSSIAYNPTQVSFNSAFFPLNFFPLVSTPEPSTIMPPLLGQLLQMTARYLRNLIGQR